MAGKLQLDFERKRVIVAGGSRGIGRSIALGFAAAGAAVSICARGAEALGKTKSELGPSAHAATCDLADSAQVSRYIVEAAEALGGLDVLVNNASGFGMTDDEPGWEASIAVDLLATVRASRVALPYLEKAGGGAIVNISSISGLQPTGRSPAYGAVKAAVIQLTMSSGRCAGAQERPRQLHRAWLNRVSRRLMGASKDLQPGALPAYARNDSLRPSRSS